MSMTVANVFGLIPCRSGRDVNTTKTNNCVVSGRSRCRVYNTFVYFVCVMRCATRSSNVAWSVAVLSKSRAMKRKSYLQKTAEDCILNANTVRLRRKRIGRIA